MRFRSRGRRTGLSLVEVVVALLLVGVTATAAAALLIVVQRAERWRARRDAERRTVLDSVVRARGECTAPSALLHAACQHRTGGAP
jgi:prepilin-type N-terminal cleavage/methylation domain-containing protein